MKIHIVKLFLAAMFLFSIWNAIPIMAQTEIIGRPAFIRLEITKDPFPDSIQIQLWEELIDSSSDTPNPIEYVIPLQKGNMYEGTLMAKVLDWTSPSIQNRAFVTIRNNRYQLLDKFIIEPADSVRIGFDLERGVTLFAGPAGDKFRVQHELQKSIAEQSFAEDPPFFTNSEEFWNTSSKDSSYYFNSLEKKSPVHRMILPLANTAQRTAYLKDQLSINISDHPGWIIMANYKDLLEEEFLDLLGTELMGKILFGPVDSFRKTYTEDPAFIELFESLIVEKKDCIPDKAAISPHFMEYLYTKNVVISAITKTPFRDLLNYDDGLVNQTLEAKFIFQNFRRFEDSNAQFEKSLTNISNPALSEMLKEVYRAQKIGVPVSSIPLQDDVGNEVRLNEPMGKFLLLSFWLPGCSASESAYKHRISAVEEYFSQNNELEVIYIASAKDLPSWEDLVRLGKYSNPDARNYRSSQKKGSFLDYYNIRSFPTMMLIDPEGNMVNNGNFQYSKEGLIAYLKSQLEAYAEH